MNLMGGRSSLTALSHAGVGLIHGLTACWGLDYRSADGFLDDGWRMCHYLTAAGSVPHAFWKCLVCMGCEPLFEWLRIPR